MFIFIRTISSEFSNRVQLKTFLTPKFKWIYFSIVYLSTAKSIMCKIFTE